MNSLLARLFSLVWPRRKPAPRTAPRARLRVEALEERATPATTAVSSTATFPGSAAVSIETRWDSNHNGKFDSADAVAFGTGALVGPHHVLTAAHVVWSPATALNSPTWTVVYPGRRGAHDRPFGEAYVTRTAIPLAYTASLGLNDAHDIALLTLDRNVGNLTGKWFDYGWIAPAALQSRNPRLAMRHYPADSGGRHDGYHQFASEGQLARVGADHLYYDDQDFATEPGSSGAPVFTTVNLNDPGRWGVVPTVIAVHHGRNGDEAGVRKAALLTPGKFQWLLNEQARTRTVTDRPDLMDADTWATATTSQVSPQAARGGGRVHVNVRVRNGGTATAQGFTVAFYASTSPTIDPRRAIPLGKTTVRSLAVSAETVVSWSGPLKNARTNRPLPAGRYYVGWVIDAGGSVRELNETTNASRGESSNTGYHPVPITVS